MPIGQACRANSKSGSIGSRGSGLNAIYGQAHRASSLELSICQLVKLIEQPFKDSALSLKALELLLHLEDCLRCFISVDLA